MRQVWILNHYAAEPTGVGGTRHFHLAEGLLKYGWETSILAASIELNSGRDRLSSAESVRKDMINGVTFLWLRVPPYNGNGVGRLVNMAAYTLRALLPSVVNRLPIPDVVVGSSVHPFAALSAALLAKRFAVPFVFEVRDLWPQTLIDLGRISEGSFAARIMQRIERWLYRRACKIVVLLPHAVEYIAPLGVSPDKIAWVPNGADLSLFASPSEAVDSEGPLTLMYFGAHGDANGLENVIHAMRELMQRECRVRLRLIGDGPRKNALRELALQLRLDNVSFEPPVPKSAVPALAKQADMFVFNLIDSPIFRYGISSNKLFDFLAAKRPIIFCCAAANNPVAEAGAGLTVAPGDAGALADAIEQLVLTPVEERRAMAERGRRHVEANYGFESLVRRFAGVLEEVCGRGAKNG